MSAPRASINDLAVACATSADATEWEEFLRHCVPVATVVVARVARVWLGTAPRQLVDDIVQEVFLKLCEKERRILRKFVPRGDTSFFQLLRLVAASVANDHFRREYSEKRGGKTITSVLDDQATGTAPESANVHKAVLYAELDRRLRSAPGATAERDRAIFWLYYLQGLTAEEIAGLPSVDLSAKGVESVLHRITAWLRNQVRTPEAEKELHVANKAGRSGKERANIFR